MRVDYVLVFVVVVVVVVVVVGMMAWVDAGVVVVVGYGSDGVGIVIHLCGQFDEIGKEKRVGAVGGVVADVAVDVAVDVVVDGYSCVAAQHFQSHPPPLK